MTIIATACANCGASLEGLSARRFCNRRCWNRHYKRVGRGKLPPLKQSDFRSEITETERAWIAGIIEGEGCLSAWRHLDTSRGRKRYAYPGVVVHMIDEDVIKRLRALTGLGRITGPNTPKSRETHQPTWRWAVNPTDEAITVICLVWPWLGKRRREQAAATLAAYKAGAF